MANNLNTEKLTGDVKSLNKELKETATILGQLVAKQQTLNKEISGSKGLKEVSDKLNKSKKTGNEIEKEAEKLTKKTNQLKVKQAQSLKAGNKEYIKQNEKVKEQNRLMREQAKADLGIKKRNGLFKSMTKSIVSATAAMLSFRAAITIVSKSFKTIAGFERGMAKVRAVTNATAGAFIALNANAQKLGATTSKSASQVAGLQLEFSKLGFSTKEILAATEATIELSIAAGSDLAESASVAASTIRGFGLDASESQRIVDVMAKSFASSGLDLVKFKTAMSNAQVAAKTTGRTLEETTAFLSVLADTGLDASKAGTDLRVIFSKLAIKGIDLNDAMEDINNSSNKVATAQKLVGDRAFSSLITLSENKDKTEELTKAYNNSAGAAKRMANIMEDDIIGEADKFKSALEGLILSLNNGDGAISKMSRGVIKLGTNILGLLTNTEKESEALQRMKIEMNANLDAIKNQELPLKIRNELIEKVNTQYKDYLPNLIDEKTSLEDIEEIQKKANIALLENIRIKAQREILDEQINKIAQLGVKIAREQIALEKLKAGEINYTASAYISQEEQIKGLEVTISRLIEEYRGEVAELDKIQSIFDTLNPKQKENKTIVEGGTEAVKRQSEAISTLTGKASTLNSTWQAIIETFGVDTAIAFKESHDEIQKQVEQGTDLFGDAWQRRRQIVADAAAGIIADEEAAEARRKEIQQSFIDSSITVANTLFDLGQSQRDTELANIESYYDKQITLAEGDTEKQEQLALQLEQERKRIAREQAQSEKNQALFNVAVSTAQGIARAVAASPTTFGLPFSAFVTAIGLAQAAAIQSQPIPGFFKGTESAPSGLAWIAERGAELLNMPSGESMLVKEPTLMNLEQGTQVKTAEQTQQLLNKAIYNEVAYNNSNIDSDKIVSAIKSQTKEVTIFDDNGIKRHLQNGNSITRYQNRRGRK